MDEIGKFEIRSDPFGDDGKTAEATAMAGKYADGNICVQVMVHDGDLDMEMPYGMLSVNIPDMAHVLGKGEFFAKNWSENAYLFADAASSDLFEDTGRTVSAGMTEAPIMKIVGRG